MSSNFSNITERLSSRAQRVLIAAQKLSEELKHAHTGTEHLLYGIITEKSSLCSEILKQHQIKNDFLKAAIKNLNSANTVDEWQYKISTDLKTSLEKAAIAASKFNSTYIGTEHLFFGILDTESSRAMQILKQKSLNPDQTKKQLTALFEQNSKFSDFLGIEEHISSGSALVSKTKEKISKSPALDYFTIDLNQRAADGKIDPVIGRAEELDRLISILNRRNKNNPVLIGEPGVGKTAIVEGLAKSIIDGDVPQSLLNKRILTLDLALVVAGSMFRGEFENRLKKVIDEVAEDPDIILFIDEIHTLVGAGATTGSLDAANILKPALARGELRAIGATTLTEYKKYIEEDPALERRFQSIHVEEPGSEEALQILKGLAPHYEKHHDLKITPEAISAAVELSVRYMPEKFLPDKAIDLIDETAAQIKTQNERSPRMRSLNALDKQIQIIVDDKKEAVLAQDFTAAEHLRAHEEWLRDKRRKFYEEITKNSDEIKSEITHRDIAKTVAKITKVPVENLVNEEVKKLAELEKILLNNIIGQEEVVKQVAHTIRRSRLKISSPDRPLGSFIFLGPSGVGKTETAKILAQEIFQNKNALIRVDMSEFVERHNVSRLIGAPAGYVGFEQGGQLTEKIRRHPYSIVLFDEIEKAHPDIFNILLQILDEGHLTDASGRTVNFKNTIVILTSNVGIEELNQKAAKFGFTTEKEKRAAEDDFEQTKQQITRKLRSLMRPELINRLDKILIFKPLDKAAVRKITKKQLDEIKQRLKNTNIHLSWDKRAADHIAENSFSPRQGARLVRVNLQENVENKIAEFLLEQELQSAEDTIKLRVKFLKDKGIHIVQR